MSEIKDDDLMKQVREMAQLSILSGRINEIQERNLRTYPFIFFNGVKSARMEYDLMHPKASRIDYHLNLGTEPNANMERRFEFLTNSVRNLLWNDIVVQVHIDEKVVFTSKAHERREETNNNS